MASTGFLLVTPLLLLSLIVIASANDYVYAPKPDYQEKPKPENRHLPTKPDYGKPTPEAKGITSLFPKHRIWRTQIQQERIRYSPQSLVFKELFYVN
ncbi:hypothetical protein SLA2020_267560 [Shorea laevis]